METCFHGWVHRVQDAWRQTGTDRRDLIYLLNNLFRHPYTKIEYIQSDLQVSRNTAIRYLEQLVAEGILFKHRIGRENFYENRELFKLLGGG